ncbi:MAG TPA: PfkB family carbohydrate kinase, partial [Candidatus Brocadiia bacterium]|nr:PfkB family carbohydrate kinase [Candidatus Brocadiia bacterium]
LLGGPCPAPEAARRFRDTGVECVVLKLGARGCLVAHDDLLEAVPAFDITPVDTTAAGDAFTAGLAAALVRGDTLQAACRYANGAGALACQTRGAQPSLPSRERLEAFLATARERMNGCGYPSC